MQEMILCTIKFSPPVWDGLCCNDPEPCVGRGGVGELSVGE
jgi:hypothetical protein